MTVKPSDVHYNSAATMHRPKKKSKIDRNLGRADHEYTTRFAVAEVDPGHQFSSQLTQQEILQQVLENGISPSYAEGVSSHIFQTLQSSGVKALLVGVIAGGSLWGLMETLEVPWSRRIKVFTVVAFGVFAAILFLLLVAKGIMTTGAPPARTPAELTAPAR